MGKDFWKDKYKECWNKAAQKEKMIVEQIERRTGKMVELFGLGVGSTEYLSGSALDHNSTKGDADLYVKDPGIFIEVTGPNITMSPADPLWIRPDKIRNALAKIEKGIGKGHFVIHIIDRNDNGQKLIRVIPISRELNNFPTINPIIRGVVETYKEIPAAYNKIMSFDNFLAFIAAVVNA